MPKTGTDWGRETMPCDDGKPQGSKGDQRLNRKRRASKMQSDGSFEINPKIQKEIESSEKTEP